MTLNRKKIMKATFGFYSRFLTKHEKKVYLLLLVSRCLIGILDAVAVLGVGYLATSVANFVSSGSNEGKILEFAGMTLLAATAKTLPGIAGLVALLFLIKALVTIQITKKMATRIAIIEARAAKEISENVLGSSLERMKSVKREDLSFAVQIGTSSAFTGIMNAFASVVSEGFLFLLLSTIFLIINPLATLAMLVYFTFLILIINWFIGRRLNEISTEAYRKIVEANRILGDLSNTFRELAVSGSRGLFFERIYKYRRDASQNIGTQTYLAGMPRHIIETGLIFGVGIFILAQSGTTNLSSAAATIGVFLAGGFRIVAALLPWQNAFVVIKINVPQAKTTWDLLQLHGEPYLKRPAPSYKQHKPVEVTCSKIYYSYPDGHQAVKDFSLKIEAGSHVAIIGPSGSGKSTLADLILGIADPQVGSVYIDGEVASLRINREPGIASYVPQAPGLVSGTLRDNITISNPDSSETAENLAAAIQDSNLGELLSQLPLGLDTEISLHDSQFSGGQLQRIGLARALFTRPSLLVLDEATSALDAESEEEIVKVINGLKGRVTVITIAHRLNSIKDADLVCYLENGSLVATGTLSELQGKNESVARAIRLLSLEDF